MKLGSTVRGLQRRAARGWKIGKSNVWRWQPFLFPPVNSGSMELSTRAYYIHATVLGHLRLSWWSLLQRARLLSLFHSTPYKTCCTLLIRMSGFQVLNEIVLIYIELSNLIRSKASFGTWDFFFCFLCFFYKIKPISVKFLRDSCEIPVFQIKLKYIGG
jgi:hypothetical protein